MWQNQLKQSPFVGLVPLVVPRLPPVLFLLQSLLISISISFFLYFFLPPCWLLSPVIVACLALPCLYIVS